MGGWSSPGGAPFRYDAKNYLVTSVTMPVQMPRGAIARLYIDIEMGRLSELINGMGQ